jgi:hypothetical protein
MSGPQIGMSRTRTRVLAFSAGARAYQEGLPLDSNPHEEYTEEWERWNSGWKAEHARSIEHAPRGK